ncbi:efflux RND transporter periplasmic adaptor subunit [Alterisphingorhabdus coralli]|uniref:Efflux RND transporter periplasmic adaptor subunit n=1 Tax=Alterisphingorhabdus coralli TaxID=3071408 RepID=A0AA97F5H0_9SPHN|nr:efflux RND transporter periplasmic adaptor subunit [Parasphingorhabdus sp. SCSIO 66989]WOE74714.1 efflux RND transporter periplasmic adaptor subunit [Parasphingorhabdus sp. SCSIO 66989]
MRSHPIISGIVVLAIGFMGYWLFAGSSPGYEYVTEPASRGDVVRTVSASGKLRALNTINVGSEISGQVTAVYVDFNSPVEEGQLLAEIDSTRPRAQVTQARAQVDLARASLAQALAAIRQAETDVQVQTREFERRKVLEEKGFVSGAGLDQAQNALVTAKATLSTAKAQAQSARAQIAQSEAQLASAELDLQRTRIIAPAAGVVINKLVEPGTTVAANFQTPNLFQIAADTSKMQVEASVDEADIGQVKQGQTVRFTVDSYPGETFRAKVQQIRKSATEAQNAVSYLVILDVDNKDGKLLTGMTANVDIETGRKRNVLRVPVSATRFRPREEDRPQTDDAQGANAKDKAPDKAVIWVAGDDPFSPESKTISIGLSGEDFVEVKEGVAPKEEVLVRVRTVGGSEAQAQ